MSTGDVTWQAQAKARTAPTASPIAADVPVKGVRGGDVLYSPRQFRCKTPTMRAVAETLHDDEAMLSSGGNFATSSELKSPSSDSEPSSNDGDGIE